MLPIAGQNDGRVEPLLITADQFRAYVERHAHLAVEGFAPVAEDNDDMTGSYVMIDPMGRFFDNVDGRLVYSPPILEVGVERAFAEVRWERQRLIGRGGIYPWRRRQLAWERVPHTTEQRDRRTRWTSTRARQRRPRQARPLLGRAQLRSAFARAPTGSASIMHGVRVLASASTV